MCDASPPFCCSGSVLKCNQLAEVHQKRGNWTTGMCTHAQPHCTNSHTMHRRTSPIVLCMHARATNTHSSSPLSLSLSLSLSLFPFSLKVKSCATLYSRILCTLLTPLPRPLQLQPPLLHLAQTALLLQTPPPQPTASSMSTC